MQQTVITTVFTWDELQKLRENRVLSGDDSVQQFIRRKCGFPPKPAHHPDIRMEDIIDFDSCKTIAKATQELIFQVRDIQGKLDSIYYRGRKRPRK